MLSFTGRGGGDSGWASRDKAVRSGAAMAPAGKKQKFDE